MEIKRNLTIHGKNNRQVEIFGKIANEVYLPVVNSFCNNFETNGEIGASIAAYLYGKPIIELYGGLRDIKAKKKWEKDTLINVYSVTKALTNFCVLLLIERGNIKFETKISSIWAEFGKNGKENITLEELLTHQAGLAYFTDFTLTLEDLEKIQTNPILREEFSSKIANEKPKWNILEKRTGYHALSVGFYVSEIIRKVDFPKHRTVSVFFQDEFAKPLGIEFYMGFDKSKLNEFDSRTSRLYPLLSAKSETKQIMNAIQDPESLPMKSFQAIQSFSPWKGRFLEIPSAIGLTTATSLARIFSILANSGKDSITNQTFFSPSTLKKANEISIQGYDQVLLREMVFNRLGLVKQVPFSNNNNNLLKDDSLFFHGGFGGSVGLAIPNVGLSFSYVTNGLDNDTVEDPRRESILKALLESFQEEKVKSNL